MTKNSLIKVAVITAVVLAASLLTVKFVLAWQTYCPQNTEAQETQATLVGEITDMGSDSTVNGWFEYGQSINYGQTTSDITLDGLDIYCVTVSNLSPCTTYHYRAVAQNTAGTAYGEDKTFTTKCAPVEPVSVDIKANGSNGPVTRNYQDYVNISWESQNADYCEASGDWSQSKSTSGYQSIQLNSVKTYTFTITCRNSDGTKTANDSVQVIVGSRPPVVITKPAIVTY